MYEFIKHREGQEKVAESVNSMATRRTIVVARNAAFIALRKATNNNESKRIPYLTGRMDALNDLLG